MKRRFSLCLLVTLVAAGCGSDGSSAPCRQAPTSLRIEPTATEWFWWEGEDTPLIELAVVAEPAPEPAGCLRVDTETSIAGLTTQLDPQATALGIAIDPSGFETGIHDATVTIRDLDGGASATLSLTGRVWRRPPAGAPRKVLVIGMDGMRGDGIPGADTPHIDTLLRRARYSFEARTQLEAPTVSGPGWTSISTGVDASKHRITGNSDWENLNRAYPSMLQRARNGGLRTVAGVHWAPIVDEIFEPSSMNSRFTGGDPVVSGGMANSLRDGDFDLHFLHLDDADAAGHALGFGPGNPVYRLVTNRIDGFVGDLVDAILSRPSVAGEEWLIVLSSDHGGQGTEHGPLTPPHRTIPLIFAGSTVEAARLPGRPSHMDVHPTVLDFLGRPPQASWNLDGSVIPLR